MRAHQPHTFSPIKLSLHLSYGYRSGGLSPWNTTRDALRMILILLPWPDANRIVRTFSFALDVWDFECMKNKESSQRFRDRTRERQREKQERLEYLERRIKDLENQLKHARGQPTPTKTDPSSSAPGHDGQPGLPTPPPAGRLVGDHETALSAMQRLQRENESLRAALKTAEKEVCPIHLLHASPFNSIILSPWLAVHSSQSIHCSTPSFPANHCFTFALTTDSSVTASCRHAFYRPASRCVQHQQSLLFSPPALASRIDRCRGRRDMEWVVGLSFCRTRSHNLLQHNPSRQWCFKPGFRVTTGCPLRTSSATLSPSQLCHRAS